MFAHADVSRLRSTRTGWGGGAVAALFAPWGIALAVMIALAWQHILLLRMWDPDDYLRLLEVRDWLGGQSWFDVTQYRLDPPHGFAMHWSRIVDLPIAGLMLFFRPLLGAVVAERAALVIVPPMILLGIMAALMLVARRIAGRPSALVAPLLVACCPPILFQTMPMRIDHHGWQTMMAMATAAMLLDRRPMRGGVLAGLSAAVWLSVSLEGVPMVAAIFGLTILRFLIASGDDAIDHGHRLRGFSSALGVGAALWFMLTHHVVAWTHTECDAMGPGWIVLLCGSALGSVIAAGHFVQGSRLLRGGLVAVGVGIGLISFLHVAPLCTSGPFGALDPVTRSFWYEHVLEGLPIWRQPADIQGMIVVFPLIGLTGLAFGWRAAADRFARRQWATLFLLGIAAFALSLLVQRTAAVAHGFALPGAAWLLQHSLGVIARWRRSALRVVGSSAAILAASPLTATGLGGALFGAVQPAAPQATSAPLRCEQGCDRYSALAALPPAYMLSSLDVAPSLLVHTPHRFAASGYHRNAGPLRRTIIAFTGDPDATRRMMAATGMTYVLIDPEAQEAAIYTEAAPHGLMARLLRGDAPAWLKPVALPGSPFRLWRRIG